MSAVTESTLTGLKTAYDRDGWCELPFRFSDEAVTLLKERVAAISRERRPEVVYEKDSDTVCGLHGCHTFDEVCAALVRHPRLVALAEELAGSPVYVYQFKVNLKQAHEGAAWPWHQDYAFWSEEDGMPTPQRGQHRPVPGRHTRGQRAPRRCPRPPPHGTLRPAGEGGGQLRLAAARVG
ncbi:phytanoyl-CoA dioxygenase family protein [Streptomyces sp. NPDC056323]|uniref:phytanoyl-CoA dioxygenase family protein n=1 Tax=Streptomyces sp. NPDC056323 TaxID=3345784 RepID=UPI0035DDCA6C